TGDLGADLTGEEVTPATRVALPAVPAVPAHADPLAHLPRGDARAHGIDDADHLVPGNTWVREARERPLLRERVAVGNATGLDLDPHRSGDGLGDIALDDLEGDIRPRDLHNAHLRHGASHLSAGRGEEHLMHLLSIGRYCRKTTGRQE